MHSGGRNSSGGTNCFGKRAYNNNNNNNTNKSEHNTNHTLNSVLSSESVIASSSENTATMNQRSRGRPAKKATCTWCAESKQLLQYVLPTQNGKKEFCSETCIAEFRKAYSKGACAQCDNVIRDGAPNKEFCSLMCMNKHQKKNGSTRSVNNGVRGDLDRNKKLGGIISFTPTGPFQYESFHVFNWDAYLEVSFRNSKEKKK